jgi:hypothetical protein
VSSLQISVGLAHDSMKLIGTSGGNRNDLTICKKSNLEENMSLLCGYALMTMASKDDVINVSGPT